MGEGGCGCGRVSASVPPGGVGVPLEAGPETGTHLRGAGARAGLEVARDTCMGLAGPALLQAQATESLGRPPPTVN